MCSFYKYFLKNTVFVLLSLFFIVMTFVLIRFRKYIKTENLAYFNIYLNTCVFSSIIYVVVSLTGSDVNFLRMSLYFSLGYILIWPFILNDVPMFNRLLPRVAFIGVHLVPYEFNPNLFP